MKRGELSPVMWIVLGMLVLLAVLAVIFAQRGHMFSLVDVIGRMFE